MPATVEERQVEHVRDVDQFLAQFENALLAQQQQTSMMLREIRRLRGNAPLDADDDYA